MMTHFVELDVRPTLRAGGEPFGQIMDAIGELGPDQGLRLLSTFCPTPLFHVLGSKGFSHRETELEDGSWEVFFEREADAPQADQSEPAPETAAGDDAWPAPVHEMDNRDLEPPEPMVKVLATIETMQPGEVMTALLCREPVFLLPELSKRGHQWIGGFEPDGTTYKIAIRIAAGAAS